MVCDTNILIYADEPGDVLVVAQFVRSPGFSRFVWSAAFRRTG